MALRFDFYNSIIEVPSPETSITIQQLINEIRDAEDELTPAMSYGHIAEAYGKQSLGNGVAVGITLVLMSPWRVAFEARSGPDTVSCRIDGGNLVGGLDGNPIAPTPYTQITMANSSSATISTPNDNTNLKYLIESLRGSHMGIGNSFYWDPVQGSDTNDGNLPSTAVKTFARAQSLAQDGNYDIIYCLSTDPSGITTVSETLNITKNTLKVRGPGYTFQLTPTATTADTVVINANTVQLSGLCIKTAATGSQSGLNITGNYNLIRDCWITNTRLHGINIGNSSFTKVINTVIEHGGLSGVGNGINITDGVLQLNMSKNIIFDYINGIMLSGVGIADNLVENNLIYNHANYGIDIGADVERTNVRGANTFTGNASGASRDLGTDTYIEVSAGGASPTEVADAVWDELLSSHTISNSAGRTLKEAKSKATLASLK